jgi:4-alpha-glucanotransferase
MNTPSLYGGNWKWRYDAGQLTTELSAKLAQLAELTDRLPRLFPVLADEKFAA